MGPPTRMTLPSPRNRERRHSCPQDKKEQGQSDLREEPELIEIRLGTRCKRADDDSPDEIADNNRLP